MASCCAVNIVAPDREIVLRFVKAKLYLNDASGETAKFRTARVKRFL